MNKEKRMTFIISAVLTLLLSMGTLFLFGISMVRLDVLFILPVGAYILSGFFNRAYLAWLEKRGKVKVLHLVLGVVMSALLLVGLQYTEFQMASIHDDHLNYKGQGQKVSEMVNIETGEHPGLWDYTKGVVGQADNDQNVRNRIGLFTLMRKIGNTRTVSWLSFGLTVVTFLGMPFYVIGGNLGTEEVCKQCKKVIRQKNLVYIRPTGEDKGLIDEQKSLMTFIEERKEELIRDFIGKHSKEKLMDEDYIEVVYEACENGCHPSLEYRYYEADKQFGHMPKMDKFVKNDLTESQLATLKDYVS